MKGKNHFKRGYCKIRKYDYNLPIIGKLAKEAAETNILPPSETIEIETNKYFVAIELYNYTRSVFACGPDNSFYNHLKEMLEEIYHKKDISLKLPYDFLQFREKGGKEWHPLIFSDGDAIGVLDFLPKRFQSQYPHIRWEKMKRMALEEAIEKACGAAEDDMDEILNYA